MSTTIASRTSWAERLDADVATSLPGATAIFRDKSLDFCRGGGISRVGAARANGLSVYALEIDLDHIATTGRAPEHRP